MISINVKINGKNIKAAAGSTVAAVIFSAGYVGFRQSVGGESRAALCGMGVCYECRVMIDGRTHVKSCQTPVKEGMEIIIDG